MVDLASKLLILLVVLLMPLGMPPATAAAQHEHPMASSMPMQHCPDPAPEHETVGFGVCAMACAAALPALGDAIADPPVIVCAPQQPAAAQLLHGLHPETATPPPKRS